MSDIECPYCKCLQDIFHEGGYSYGEDEEHEHEQYCENCGELFKYLKSFSISYEALCNGDHYIEESRYYPKKDKYLNPGEYWYQECTRCEYSKMVVRNNED